MLYSMNETVLSSETFFKIANILKESDARIEQIYVDDYLRPVFVFNTNSGEIYRLVVSDQELELWNGPSCRVFDLRKNLQEISIFYEVESEEEVDD